MCGRFSQTKDLATLADRFEAIIHDLTEHLYKPRYNIAPGQRINAIIEHRSERYLRPLQWGLIPSWANDPAIGFKTFNARAETLAEKASFKSAYRSRRCLIPADGFYEWIREGKAKKPMYFTLRSEEPFAFAGLWETWQPPGDSPPLETCTLITTTPNALVQPVHDRMPVILTQAHEQRWMDHTSTDPAPLQDCLTPYPADQMQVRPVNPVVNATRHDEPDCLSDPPATGLFDGL